MRAQSLAVRRTTLRLLAVVGLLLTLSACAWRQADHQQAFDANFAAGQYRLAAQNAERHNGSGFSPSGDNSLLWTLQRATALQSAGDIEQSIALFDTTESWFQMYDLDGMVTRWMEEVGAVFTNDAALPYRGTLYDAIMVNTYKALGFMALGDMDNARIELNRARDRQRRAVASFAEQIAAEQEALQKRQEQARQADMERSLNQANERLSSEYQALEAWSIYPAFVNPMATWLEGLFLMTQAQASGDFSRAADALDRAAGMVPDNPAVAADRAWANDLADGRLRHGDLPPTVWVLFENGLGPVRQEQQIQIPISFRRQDTHAIWTGIAFPVLRYRDEVSGGLSIATGDEDRVRAQVLANMDAVISTEFREALPRIVARAVAASVARTTVQYQMQRQWGDLAGFVGLIYQLFSTQADTRIWSALPKTLDLARLDRPEDDRLSLHWAGRSQELELPDARFTLIWVRLPRAGAEPGIQIIPLD